MNAMPALPRRTLATPDDLRAYAADVAAHLGVNCRVTHDPTQDGTDTVRIVNDEGTAVLARVDRRDRTRVTFIALVSGAPHNPQITSSTLAPERVARRITNELYPKHAALSADVAAHAHKQRQRSEARRCLAERIAEEADSAVRSADAAAEAFARTWGGDVKLIGDLADELSCPQIEALAGILRAVGAQQQADAWITSHVRRCTSHPTRIRQAQEHLHDADELRERLHVQHEPLLSTVRAVATDRRTRATAEFDYLDTDRVHVRGYVTPESAAALLRSVLTTRPEPAQPSEPRMPSADGEDERARRA